LDNLGNQIQTQQSKLHGLWTEYETLNAKLEKIKNEYSAIEPSQKLSLELEEIKQIKKQQEETIDSLKVSLRDREHQVLILESKRIELTYRVDTFAHKLSLWTDRLKWLNK
jgi:chromosome segregation ATPase